MKTSKTLSRNENPKSVTIFQSILSLIVAGCFATTIYGVSVPELINYQGLWRDSGTGQPLTDQVVNLSFNIYDDVTSGNTIWGPQTFQNVSLLDGRFNVILGPTDQSARSIADAFSGTNRYLGISEGDPPTEFSPRQRIISTPYTFVARTVQGDNLYVEPVTGNVGIGTTTPDPSAALEVAGNKGLLVPRLSQTEVDELNPPDGTMLYNSTEQKFNFFQGGNWPPLGGNNYTMHRVEKKNISYGNWETIVNTNASGVLLGCSFHSTRYNYPYNLSDCYLRITIDGTEVLNNESDFNIYNTKVYVCHASLVGNLVPGGASVPLNWKFESSLLVEIKGDDQPDGVVLYATE